MTEPAVHEARGAPTPAMQRHALAAMLRNKDTFVRCRSFVTPELFSDETTSDVMAWTLNQWDTHHEIPSRISMLDAFKESENARRIIKRAFSDEIDDEKVTVARLAEFARQRAMKKALQRAVEITTAKDRGEPVIDDKGRPIPADKIPDPVKLLMEASQVGTDTSDDGVLLSSVIDRIAGRALNPPQNEVFKTGMLHFDDCGVVVERGEVGAVLAKAKGGKCVRLDSAVWTRHGPVEMQDIATGCDVFGLDQGAHTPRSAKVLHYARTGRKKMCCISLRSGRFIDKFAVTHPVLTLRGWVRTGDLKKGDFVIAPAVLPLDANGSSVGIDECWMVGVFTGDGSWNGRSPHLHSHLTDDVDIFSGLWPLAGSHYLKSDRRTDEGFGVRHTFRVSLGDVLECYGMVRGALATEKRIPSTIYRGGVLSMAAFLAGLFDTDGSVYVHTSGLPHVELTVESEKLATDVVQGLHCLGIYAAYRRRSVKLNGKRFPAYCVTLRDSYSVQRFRETVGAHMRHSRKVQALSTTAGRPRGAFCARVPYVLWSPLIPHIPAAMKLEMVSPVKRRTKLPLSVVARLLPHAPAPVGNNIRKWCTGEFLFDEVKSVSRAGFAECADIEVSDPVHSFVCEQVFTHNSHFLLNIAINNALDGKRVIYYNMEIKEEKLEDRFGNHIAGPKADRKLDPVDYCRRLQKRYDRFYKGRGDVMIKRYVAKKVTINDISAHLLRQIASGFIPDCLAAGSLVLTDLGLFPIENVPGNSRVWDGTAWVTHDGPLYKGERDVIRYCGITATPDHKVWTEFGWRSLITCARLGLRVAKTGVGRHPLRVGDHYVSDSASSTRSGKLDEVRVCAVHDVQEQEVGVAGEPPARGSAGVSRVPPAEAFSAVAVDPGCATTPTLHESEARVVAALRGAWDKVPVSERIRSLCVDPREHGGAPESGDRPCGQRRGLCSGEPALVDAHTEHVTYAQNTGHAGSAPFQDPAPEREVCRLDLVDYVEQAEDDPEADRAAVESWKVGRVAVWDILNAGPLHRFTADGVLVHNCIIVDYLGLVKPTIAYDEPRHALASVWLDFRSLCQEYKLGGWSALQANREGAKQSEKQRKKAVQEDELLALSHIGESYEVGQHIDVGCSLNQTIDEKNENKGRGYVFASRNDRDGQVIDYSCDFGRSAFITSGIHNPETSTNVKDSKTTDEQREELAHRAVMAARNKQHAADHPA